MAGNDIVPELSKKEFESFVKQGHVLIDFTASWCMPCIMMSPIMDDLAKKFKGKIKFGKIDIDENPDLAERYNVVSIPNFILFKNGQKADQYIGSSSQEDFEKKLKKFV
ncbi:thioredoxin [Candidatus Pacearchaeota archaeon]|nr:thioredoxin [Candidatus Pacearchaeota archaeon]